MDEDDVICRPARDPKSSLLVPKKIVRAVLQGPAALAILASLLIVAARGGMSEPDLRAVVFTSLVLTNMALIWVNRSFKSALIAAIVQPNRTLWILLDGLFDSAHHIGRVAAGALVVPFLGACIGMILPCVPLSASSA